MIVALTATSLVVGVDAVFPVGTQEALQRIVTQKSAQYDSAISLAVFDGINTITAVAGVADVITGQTVTPHDSFVWGSGTKPLTGVSILKLVEEGKLRLEDKVAPIVDPLLLQMRSEDPSQNFSSLADLWGVSSGGNVSNVTVEELATMTLCTPDFDTAEPSGELLKDPLRAQLYATPSVPYSPTELLSMPWVAGHWPTHLHGYSSTNFMLLGLILAAKSGASSWSDYRQGDVIPGGLRDAFRFGVIGAPKDFTRVHGYDRTSYNMPSNQTNNQDVWAVDGVFSGWTASDLVASPISMARLYWEIYGPNPSIAADSAKVMAVPRSSGLFYGFATFGLSERTGQNSSYGDAWGHLGATYGYDSIILYFPKLGFTMAVASNVENDDQPHPSDTACFAYNAVAGLMLGQQVKCVFTDVGYHGGGCYCDQFSVRAVVI